MAKTISGASIANILEGEKLIVTGAKEKREYVDGQATGKIEAARVEAVGQNVGGIHVDLVPFAEDKLQRAQGLFGKIIVLDDLLNVSEAKIGIYHENLNITITAADIKAPGKG